jgi:hypothetical protein
MGKERSMRLQEEARFEFECSGVLLFAGSEAWFAPLCCFETTQQRTRTRSHVCGHATQKPHGLNELNDDYFCWQPVFSDFGS